VCVVFPILKKKDFLQDIVPSPFVRASCGEQRQDEVFGGRHDSSRTKKTRRERGARARRVCMVLPPSELLTFPIDLEVGKKKKRTVEVSRHRNFLNYIFLPYSNKKFKGQQHKKRIK
jgi:hypothetical protein